MMQGRYLWADGQLDLLPGFGKTHHRQMLRNMIDSGRLPGVPQNILAGDFSTDDFHGPMGDRVSVIWQRGETPSADEVKYMIQQELGRFDREASLRRLAKKLAVPTSEDTEPSGGSVGFLAEPKKALYPPLFPDGDKIPQDVIDKLKDHVLEALTDSFDNPDAFIYFTIYGSGICFNWDEGGDLDMQMWVDFDKFANQNNKNWTADDVLAEVRRLIGPINFPTFADLGIKVPPDPKVPCDGTMMIQYYAKLGTGSKEENLASQPYACYDMETGKWLVKPKPMPPTFYGDAFLALMPKATDMATQAEALISEYNRNVLNWQFWFSLYSRHKRPEYHKEYLESQRNAILEKQSIKTMFDAVFGGRAEAYAPGGKGIRDERDIMQKLLEVWGIFQSLKHYARAPLPWDEQELPPPPSPEESKDSSHVAQDRDSKKSEQTTITHGWTLAKKSKWRKISMPADPDWVQNWIAENGPYLYHGSGGREQYGDPMNILHEGIVPRPRPNPIPQAEDYDWTDHDPQQFQYPDAYDMDMNEWWHNPRPGHVFMVTDPQAAYGHHLFRIDIRGLDPKNFNPDDDYLRETGDTVGPLLMPGIKYPNIPDSPFQNWDEVRQHLKTLGEQAEEQGWGDNPEDTHNSWESHPIHPGGVVAYRGTIPPHLIEHVADRDDHYDDWRWKNTSKWHKQSNQEILDANRGDDLHGLPGAVNVPGYGRLNFGSHGELQDIARNYMNNANMPYDPPRQYAKVDPDRARRIAEEYENMQHNPNDPEVQSAYNALINETYGQYQALKNAGYNFEFYPQTHDPYPNSPREAVLDLHQNKHMYVYPTDAGFGTLTQQNDHPLLQDSGERWNGQPVLHNDLFRAVHDVFGHAKEGVGFRADGEENAWRQHAAMFSPEARRALTSETRGQNSWVNFGPYGEQNQKADQASTVYADQKAGLLPEWVSSEGDHDNNWQVTAGQYDSPEHRDPGGWAGIMEKAQRLRQQGGVTVTRNGVQNIAGTVVGDHGTYNTEIWRQDPNRGTISLWNCTCPWNDYSWGRTRQWKKFEGRPCAHTLALYWEAQTQPLDEEYGQNQQLNIPGLDPYGGNPPPDATGFTGDLNQAVQQTIQPGEAIPGQSQIVQQGPPQSWQDEQLTFPGTFSKWRKQGALQNGDYARINKQMIGYDDNGTQYTVLRNSIVEIIWSDPQETIAIYSLPSGPLGPHNARITDETQWFSWVPRTRGTAPRRRR